MIRPAPVDYTPMNAHCEKLSHTPPAIRRTMLRLFQVFVLLQIIDALTTILVLNFGGQELNPVLRGFMHLGPIAGLIAGKVMVLGIGAFVVWVERPRVLTLANTFYAGLAGWNVVILLALKA